MRVFNVDISRKGISPVVQVTEHDAMSRFFTLVLRDGAADYEEPEGATYSVWYKTKDSHGWYDTITEPDNGTHPAVVADGNEYTIEIAEQATTSCGELALCITAPDGYQLTVSGIITRSDDIPGYDGEEVENYYNVFITRMQENAARAENAADIAVAYGATVEVDEEAQQLNITHHSDTEGGVGWLFGSAVTNSASGSVAAFPDGANDVAVKSLVAEITPVQDLHGQSNAYPPGGGKNLLENGWGGKSATVNGLTATIAEDGGITINGTATATGVLLANMAVANSTTASQNWRKRALPNGTYKFVGVGNGINLQVRGTNSEAGNADTGIAASNVGDGTFTIDDTYQYNWVRLAFSNGTTANNREVYPMIVRSTETDTTYAPYSNICPISGRTGLSLTTTGKNLCGELLQGYWAFADGAAGASNTWVKTPKIKCKAGTMYTASSAYESHWMGFVYFDDFGGYVGTDNSTGQTKHYTATAPTGAAYMAVNINSVNSTSAVHPEDVANFQLEESAVQTVYEPYAGHTYPITWQTQAGTVYGGTLDVVSGVLTVDKLFAEFAEDKYTLTYNSAYTNTYGYGNSELGELITPNTGAVVTKAICNMLPSIARNVASSTPGIFQYHGTLGNQVRLTFPRESAYDAPSKIYALGVTAVIPLKEPLAVYQLSPTEIKTLLGGNTIYTDAGSVSVDYIADTKLYIDNKVAELQALILEN